VLSNVIEEAGHLNEFSIQAHAIVELAVVQRHQGMQDAAQKLLAQANDYYRRIDNVTGYERVATELSWISLDRHDPVAAQSYLALIVEGKGANRWLNLAAHVALRSGNLQQALDFAEQAQQAYQGDLPHFARVSALLGQIYYELGNSNVAIDHLSSALDMMQHTHDLLGHARARMNLAAVYLGIGNLRKAIDYLRDLPDDLERLGDMDSLQATVKNLELLNRVARHWKSRSA
jgi:tetratricopeptide (TPR) repeat protein